MGCSCFFFLPGSFFFLCVSIAAIEVPATVAFWATGFGRRCVYGVNR